MADGQSQARDGMRVDSHQQQQERALLPRHPRTVPVQVTDLRTPSVSGSGLSGGRSERRGRREARDKMEEDVNNTK